MPDKPLGDIKGLTEKLAESGYWPARAALALKEGRLSSAVSLCRTRLEQEPSSLAGQLIYARSLYQSGQLDLADEQYLKVLSLDPDNLVALKLLGDIRYASGDEVSAKSYYGRVLAIDSRTEGLRCALQQIPKTTTRTITIARQGESSEESGQGRLREIPFYTETMGDLYMAQGHARLAAEVFRTLIESNRTERLTEKLARAEGKIKEKEN